MAPGWAGIAANALWVLGAAMLLTTLSWASWLTARSATRLRDALAACDVQCWLDGAWALVCLGLAWTARSTAECVVWAGLALYFVLGAVRSERSPKRPLRATHVAQVAARSRTWPHTLARAVLAGEPVLLLASAPLLLFPGRWTPAAVACLALPWLARRWEQGWFTARSSSDGPLLVIILVLPLSLWTATDAQRSLPKLWGIVLGLATYYALVNIVRREHEAVLAGVVLAVAGLGASALALLGADWSLTGATVLPRVLGGLGRWMARVVGLPGGGFHPNEVAGMLALFLPFAASLLALRVSDAFRIGRDRGWPDRWPTRALGVDVLLLVSVLLMTLTLAATGSVSAFLGVGVALCALALLWGGRRGRALALLVALVAALACLRWLTAMRAPGSLLALGNTRGLSARYEIWSRALYMLQDFPIAGVGLGNFPVVANRLYPLLTIAPQRMLELSHAHNVFLQIGMDLGMPGLVAYCALLLGFAATWRLAEQRWRGGPLRAVSAGLVCGVLAYHVYGLADCIALGARAGVFLWAMLGLMAALANLAQTQR